MSLAKKILGNTAAQVAGRFTTAFLAVIVVKILTNYLGQAGYGQYATIYEFLAFFGAFADFGIFTITLREMSKAPEQEERIFGNSLTMRTLFTAFFMMLASLAAFCIPAWQGTIIPLGVLVASLSTFFVIMSGTLSVALQIRFSMHLHALALVMGKVLTVFLIVIIVQNFYPESSPTSFLWLIWAGTFGAFLTFVLTFLFTRKRFPVHFFADKKIITELFVEAAPFAVALALSTLYLRVDVILLSFLLPPSDAQGICHHALCGDQQAGLYAVGSRILEITLMIPIYFMNSVLPPLTEKLQKPPFKEEKKREEKVFEEKQKENASSQAHIPLLQRSFQFLLVLGISAGFLLFLLAKEVVLIVSSPEFLSNTERLGSDFALQILAALIPLAFFSLFFGFLLIAVGKQKILIIINTLALSCNLIGNILFIPTYGFPAAALTSLASEFLLLALMFFFSRKHLPFEIPRKETFFLLFAFLVAGAITTGFSLVLPIENSFLRIALLGSCYSLLLGGLLFPRIRAEMR